MKISRMVLAASLILALVPGASIGRDEPCKILAERVAKLEMQIKVLEARVAALELEISKLSGRPGILPKPGLIGRENWNLLEIGMTREDVRRLLGEPDYISMLSYLEIWDYSTTYSCYCSVTFDENGRVESWDGP